MVIMEQSSAEVRDPDDEKFETHFYVGMFTHTAHVDHRGLFIREIGAARPVE